MFVKVLFQQNYGTSGGQLSFMTSKYRSKIAEPNPAVKRRIICAIQTPDCTRQISLLYSTPSVKDRTTAQALKCCSLTSELQFSSRLICVVFAVVKLAVGKMDFSGYFGFSVSISQHTQKRKCKHGCHEGAIILWSSLSWKPQAP